MEDFFVGVDLHKTQFTICVLHGEDVIDNGNQYPFSSEGFESFAARMQILNTKEDKVIIAIESTGNARFFKQKMESYGFEVRVVNTLRFKVVNLSTNKTDAHDAMTLAGFLKKDMLPESNLCSASSEGIRRILKSRSLLVEDTVALKNQAHAVMLAYGKQTKRSAFQSKKGRKTITDSTAGDLKKTLEALFETEEVLENQVKTLEGRLKELTKDNRYVNLLMTVPGIGTVNACTIASYIDNISRFCDYKHFSAFCGLVPWVQTSNNSSYYGRITKRGPVELRTAIVQCVVAMVRMPEKTENTNLMKSYKEIKDKKCSGKAIIATARRLSRIIYIMLSQNVEFDSNLA